MKSSSHHYFTSYDNVETIRGFKKPSIYVSLCSSLEFPPEVVYCCLIRNFISIHMSTNRFNQMSYHIAMTLWSSNDLIMFRPLDTPAA